MTLRKCGIHDTTLWYSNATWNVKYLRRIKDNGSGSGFSKAGDSGGLSFTGIGPSAGFTGIMIITTFFTPRCPN